MEAHKQIQFTPDGSFSVKDLDRFLFELEARFKAKEVMHRKDAAAYLGVSERTLDRLSVSGVIKYHTLEGLSGKLYLRSEILEKVKAS